MSENAEGQGGGEPERGRLLIVDDDPVAAGMLQLMLKKHGYETRCVASGSACLDIIDEFAPEVVLLDIEMPGGMDGYETCERIRTRFERAKLTVIFISGHDSLEERLRAYDVGGDDFVAKPFDAEEMRRKISLAVSDRLRRRELVEEKASLKQTADTAMHGYADMGATLRFTRGALECQTLRSLAEQILAAMRSTESDCHVQLRGSEAAGTLTLTPMGLATELEESVIARMKEHDRIFQFKTRMILNYGPVSVLVVNMPEDEAKAGRIRDYGAIIAEAAQGAVANISLRADAVARAKALKQVAEEGHAQIETLQHSYSEQQAETQRALEAMVDRLEAMYYRMGLSDNQEATISDAVREARDEVLAMFAHYRADFDDKLAVILEGLNRASAYEIEVEETSTPVDELWG